MRLQPTRFARPLLLAAAATLFAYAPHNAQAQARVQAQGLQQQKPSAAVPASNFAASAPASVASPLTPAQRPAHRAEVRYTQGNLVVSADNSSLNQILREIGRVTGIRITGGVADERVFGNYGPSSPSDVLEALLDGTGSNMLLVQPDSSAQPATTTAELILTPRHGGPTPPNPNAPGFDDDSPSGFDAPPSAQPAPAAVTAPPANQAAPAQPATTPAAAPAVSAPSSTDPNDPNAVKTPQQIFEQLQRIRQQTPPPS